MIVNMEATIVLTEAERMELNQRAARRSGRADDARRARLILLLEAGHTWKVIRDKLDCNDAFIDRWMKRFREERLAGLFSRHAGQEASTLTPALEARILEWTVKRKAPDGSTQWSTRKLGSQLKVSHMMVARVWAKHGLKPQRLDRYMATNDPDFETKAADIIGLYLNPPAHAAVFCVDEKTTIQALDRKDPVLPLSPGRAERHGFEYFRHGTLSLYAAFNTKTGEVLGKTAARHTSAEFVAFLADIVVNQPRGKEIHVIADNLSTHKTPQVGDFLESHPHVHLHFTPTYSSWLNQVELWFAKIERDVIARGVFTSLSSFTLSFDREQVLAPVIVPNAMKSAFRANLLALGPERFEGFVSECLREFRKSLGKVAGATPWMEVVQRRWNRGLRAEPVIDALHRLDPRTAASRDGKNASGVKQQREWLLTAYEVIAKRRSNIQLAFAGTFPYDRCPDVRTPEIVDHIANA